MPPKAGRGKRREPAETTLETGLFDMLANPDRLGSVHEVSPLGFGGTISPGEEAMPLPPSPVSPASPPLPPPAPPTPASATPEEHAPAATAVAAVAHEARGDGVDVEHRKRAAYVKLLRFQTAGQQLTRPMSMADGVAELENEVLLQEAMMLDRAGERMTRDGVRFARRMLLAFTSFSEFMNKRYDPFGVDLEGWSDAVMENITDYDRPFERLIEKYKGRATMSPEAELLVTLGSSLFMFHLSKAFAAQLAAAPAAAAAAAPAAPAARVVRKRGRRSAAAALVVSDASDAGSDAGDGRAERPQP